MSETKPTTFVARPGFEAQSQDMIVAANLAARLGITLQDVNLGVTIENDRKLKTKVANIAIVFTAIFTTLSYAVICCNSIFKWGISEIAITALIIETPLQFIALLAIITRNLFPAPVINNSLPERIIPQVGGRHKLADVQRPADLP